MKGSRGRCLRGKVRLGYLGRIWTGPLKGSIFISKYKTSFVAF